MSLKQYINEVLIPNSLSSDTMLKNGIKKWIKYDQIAKYSNINQLLGSDQLCLILLQTEDASTGHWCILFRDPEGILSYFDSTGKDVDYWSDRYYNGDRKDLLDLIEKSGEDYYYSKFQFQNGDKGNHLCGRWCILRSKFRDISPEKFRKYFGKKITLTPTQLCAILI